MECDRRRACWRAQVPVSDARYLHPSLLKLVQRHGCTGAARESIDTGLRRSCMRSCTALIQSTTSQETEKKKNLRKINCSREVDTRIPLCNSYQREPKD